MESIKLASMKTCRLLIVLGVIAGGAAARAASFDCSKAKRPVEKAICDDPRLNLADEGLGRVYRDTLGKLSSGSVGLLRADQVQWLAWVQQVCHADQASKSPADMAKCLLPLYGERTKHLRIAVVRREGLGFLTRTQYLASPDEDPPSGGTEEHPGFGTLQASWPVADTADPKWAAWNRAVEAHVFAMTGLNRETGAQKPPAWTASLADEADAVITAQVKTLEHNRVTVAVNMESMGHGAAHPNEAFETFTWLLDSGRPLNAGDVFAQGSAWKRLVAAACWKTLSTGEQKTWIYHEVNGPNAKPLQDVIANTGNWTLEPDGLHISYPEYSVAPRVSPIDDTVIPWLQLKPLLREGFVTP